VLIVAARSIESLYILPALCRLALFPNVTIIPVVAQNQNFTAAIRSGKPTDHIPDLSEDDIVFAAGAPDMVGAAAGWLGSDAPSSRPSNRAGETSFQAAELNAQA